MAGFPGASRAGACRPAGRLICAWVLAMLLLGASANAAVLTVTTTADDLIPGDGSVSLREAITAIDAGNDLGDADIQAENPGTFGSGDTINFAIPGQGRHEISVGGTGGGALPAITKPVTIDGYSQSGASKNTVAAGDNARLSIALGGAGAGSSVDGLDVEASGVTIEGLNVFGFSSNQIELRGGGDRVSGDEIGYDGAGGSATSLIGVAVTQSSTNLIGGTARGARNVISGNTGSGVVIAGTTSSPAESNDVEGNLIGTTPSGLAADGNARSSPYRFVGAVLVDGGSGNAIGGAEAGAGNVISGNGAGVNIRNGGHYNAVQDNLIGVAANGHSHLGNAGYGVRIGSSGKLAPPQGPGQTDELPTAQNVVGALAGYPANGTGNVIAFNGGDGVLIQGTPQNNAVQRANSGNSVLSDSIYANHGLAIHLLPAKGGRPPNNLMKAPAITGVTSGAESSAVTGALSLPGRGGMRVYVELFVSATCGTGPRGQGQKLLGSVQTRTNSGGRASFTVHVASLSPGQIVTATATNTTRDPSVHDGSAKVLDTSEFSRCFKVRPRPTRTAVVCQPTTVPVGSVTRCTATVADAAPGPGATPRGSVHFSTSSSGSFSQGGKCTLKGGRCQITYTPKEVGTGTVRITARFGGSRSHTASAGHAKLAVQRAQ